uniref:Uncharacterized protein n=1 Tax=Anguilla anguilla TaxID=7936 RepID=A0A0E9SA56_ANGAN
MINTHHKHNDEAMQ